MYRFGDLPHQTRLRQIELLGMSHRPLHNAVVGIDQGHEILALAFGTYRGCRAENVRRIEGRIHVFHWWGGKSRMGWLAARLDFYHPRLQRWRRPLPDMIRYWANGEGRAGWTRTIQDLLLPAAARSTDTGRTIFGIVLHTGIGQATDIRGDLNALSAMMDDRTLVLLGGMERGGPRRAFEHLLANKGWSGVDVNGLAQMQIPTRAPKARKLTCHAE